jgi:hypothetical protein
MNSRNEEPRRAVPCEANDPKAAETWDCCDITRRTLSDPASMRAARGRGSRSVGSDGPESGEDPAFWGLVEARGSPGGEDAAIVGRDEAAGRDGRTITTGREARHLAGRTRDGGIRQARVAAGGGAQARAIARPDRLELRDGAVDSRLRPSWAAAAGFLPTIGALAVPGVIVGVEGGGGCGSRRDRRCRRFALPSQAADEHDRRQQQPAGDFVRSRREGTARHSESFPRCDRQGSEYRDSVQPHDRARFLCCQPSA